MSSNPLNRLTRSFTFRLSVGYATLFMFSAVILFGLLYLLLAQRCKARTRKSSRPGSGNARRFMKRRPSALQDLVQRSRDSDKDKSFFIRLAGQQGSVLLLTAARRLGSVRHLGAGSWRRSVATRLVAHSER